MTDTPDAPQDFSSYSPELAAAELVKMSAAFKVSQPAPGPYGLSAEEANAQLAAMTEAYNKTKPTTLPAADAAVLGDDRLPRETEVTTWPEQNTRNKLSTIEELRSIGIPDEGIARIIAGKGYTKQDVDFALRWRQRAMNDPELRKAILSGDHVARHVLTAMSALIAMGPGSE